MQCNLKILLFLNLRQSYPEWYDWTVLNVHCTRKSGCLVCEWLQVRFPAEAAPICTVRSGGKGKSIKSTVYDATVRSWLWFQIFGCLGPKD